MMRIGYLPSDFNPMILMLGEAEDCRALGGVLRRFARAGQQVWFADLGFCRLAGTSLTLVSADSTGAVEQTGPCHFTWCLPPEYAIAFADLLDTPADPTWAAGSEHLDCETQDSIAVTVSREYTDDFLAG